MKRLTLLPLVLLLALTACTEKRELPVKLASFKVETTADRGSPEALLPFLDAPMLVDVSVTALSNKGEELTDFTGQVTIFVAPGTVQTADLKQTVRLDLVNGKGAGQVNISQVYGRTHICAKDDRRAELSTHAAGCSETFWFDMPRIDQVQVTTDNTTSPLIGAFLEVRTGDLIVTGIFAEGFYVTDLNAPEVADRAGDFDSLFIFSFSYPEGVVMGDRLTSVIGTVQEFTGSTQLVFPSWTRANVPTAIEDIPDPVLLTDVICDAPTQGTTAGLCGHNADDLDMESLEAAVVKVEGALTPSRWIDCDWNLDGDVPNYDDACVDSTLTLEQCEDARATGQLDGTTRVCCEIACKANCNLDQNCSELSGLMSYGQWSVSMNGGNGPKINVITREGLPEHNPLAPENMGILIDIAGNLRHSLPARPRWVIVARRADDVVARP